MTSLSPRQVFVIAGAIFLLCLAIGWVILLLASPSRADDPNDYNGKVFRERQPDGQICYIIWSDYSEEPTGISCP